MNRQFARLLCASDHSANWSADNPVLLKGELGLETDTRRVKIGNGVGTWNSLSYVGVTLPTNADQIWYNDRTSTTSRLTIQETIDRLAVRYNRNAAQCRFPLYQGPTLAALTSWTYSLFVEEECAGKSAEFTSATFYGSIEDAVEGVSAEILAGGSIKGTVVKYDVSTWDLDEVEGTSAEILTGGSVKGVVIEYNVADWDLDEVESTGAEILTGGSLTEVVIPYDIAQWDLDEVEGIGAEILAGGEITT